MAENFHYDAFISYRHSEADMFVAENLHKALEGFKLPNALKKKLKDKGKTKITRIFRDRDELPLASNLSDQINQALENSDFLIVICSPRLKESQWCRREIQKFTELHGQEKILAVLIEGEPADSFPDEILYREEEVTMADGTVTLAKVPVEPLAADVRGKDKKEIKKNINEEVTRLVAPIFDLNYDDLKRRHHERKVKRIISIAAAVSAVFLIFGAVSTAMAIQIKERNVEIQAANEQIEAQSEEINDQYQKILLKEAKDYAETSLEAYADNDEYKALQYAYMSVTKDEEGNTMPYTEEGFGALIQAIGAYETGENYPPTGRIYSDNIISKIDVSDDMKYFYTEESTGLTKVYDVETREMLLSFDALSEDGDTIYDEDKTICFLSDGKLIYGVDKNLCIYDFINRKPVLNFAFDHNITDITVNEDLKLVLAEDYGDVVLLNYETGSKLYSYDTKYNESISHCIGFTEDNSYAVFAVDQLTSDLDTGVNIYFVSTEDGSLVKTINVSDMTGTYKMRIFDDSLVIECDENYSTSQSYNYNYQLISLDLWSGKENWRYTMYGYFDGILASEGEEGKYVIVAEGSNIYILDYYTGEEIQAWTMSSDVLSMYLYVNGRIGAFTDDGCYSVGDPDSGITLDLVSDIGDNLTDAYWTENGMIILPKKSKYVYFLEKTESLRAEALLDVDDGGSHRISSDGKILYSLLEEELTATNIADGKVLFDVPCEGYYIDYLKPGIVIISGSDGFSAFDGTTGETVFSYEEEGYYVREQVGEAAIMFSDNDCYYRFNAEDLSVDELMSEDTLDTTSVCFSDDGNVIAYSNKSTKAVSVLFKDGTTYDTDYLYEDAASVGITPDNKYLVCQSKTSAIKIYDLTEKTLVKEEDSFDITVSGIYSGTEDYPYIFEGSMKSAWLNSDLETSFMSSNIMAAPCDGYIYVIKNSAIYRIPVYNLDMAIEDAEVLLTKYTE